MNKLNICVMGGSGFVGGSLCEQLVQAGHRVKILTRSFKTHRQLLVLPGVNLKQIDPYQLGDLFNEFQGQDVVINLIGVLNSDLRGKKFSQAHEHIPELNSNACQQTGVKRIIHVSALHASETAPSEYLRSKARSEAKLLAARDKGIDVTIFRPSVMFGPNDEFLNRFARLLQRIPLFFPLACPDAKFQPLFVDDLSRAMVQSLTRRSLFNQTFNVCGPKVYTLLELVEYVARLRKLKRKIFGLSDTMSRLQARILQRFPGQPFTLDNYLSMHIDSVCEEDFEQLFGFPPTPLERIAPNWLLDEPVAEDRRRRTV